MANVNGPVNMVRLEGSCGDVNKVLYLLMDIHEPEESQRECPEEDNIDLHHYLRKQFEGSKKTGKNYDFFMEIMSEESKLLNMYPHVLKEKYIIQTKKFFLRHFKQDERQNKVLQSIKLPHVRFHYIDIIVVDRIIEWNIICAIKQVIYFVLFYIS